MTTAELILWCVVVLVGIMGSAMCSGLEVGLYSVSRVFLRVRSVDQPRAQSLSAQIENPAPILTTLLVYNNIFNYLATLAITALLSATALSEVLIILLQAVCLTPILLIFAESIPKELFRSRANLLMVQLAPLIGVMRLTLTVVPVTPIITFIAAAASKLIGADLSGSVRSARQHMADLIKHADDQITPSQTQMIDRALQLNQTPVRLTMVPLHRVVKIKSTSTRLDALSATKKTNHSRYPVTDEQGKFIGTIDTLDLYTSPDTHISELIRPIARVLDKTSMRNALKEMNLRDARLAIVTRKGHDVGLITRKDLLSTLIDTTHDW
ncbi:MAG: DUF21 domain-containing protein [Phycisphaerales bacterium]|nr:DUF21 domain-containing protein [Phycisphaerales bacterium]